MPIKNPPHPGLSVRIGCLEPLGLTVTEGAKALGVRRTTLSRLINERAAVSPEMAIRLSKAFGSTPGAWIRLQAAYDTAQAEARAHKVLVERYQSSPAASP
jgi:addiction module HigA family antidote